MKGNCGDEFKPYTPCCENCNSYAYCMKKLNEHNENNLGDNYPLRPFEEDIKNNKEHFKRYRPITDAEVIVFKDELEDMTIDRIIKTLELYKEEI